MIDIRAQRSVLHFGILMIIATATAMFLLAKVQETIAEANILVHTQVYAIPQN